MCLTVVCDDGHNFPAWEAETCAELIQRLGGGDLVRDKRYVETVSLTGDGCLCAVDLDATAQAHGYSIDRDVVGFDVIFRREV